MIQFYLYFLQQIYFHEVTFDTKIQENKNTKANIATVKGLKTQNSTLPQKMRYIPLKQETRPNFNFQKEKQKVPHLPVN